MIKLLAGYLKPYWLLAALAMLLLGAQAVTDLYMPNLMSDIVNKGIVTGSADYILARGGIMLVAAIASITFSASSNFLAAGIAARYCRDIRLALFTKVEGFSLHEFNRFGAASLITRTTNDITQLQSFIAMGFRFILFSPVMCAGGLLMAYSKNSSLLWVLAAAVSILICIILLVIRIAMPMFRELQKKIDGLNLVLREHLMGIRVIRAFNKMDYDNARFDERNLSLTTLAIKINRLMAFMHPLMTLVMGLTSLAVTWFGGNLVSRSAMEIGDMMAFTQYAATILFSILMMVMIFVMIPRAQASAVRIAEVLGVSAGITDPESPQTPHIPGLVEFRQVGFAYAGAQEPVLSGISFTARPGETVAVIGGTGAGKSTLVNLIPRFYDVTSGAVLVGGADVRLIRQEELRKRIGFVAQGDTLFSGTVAENIRFGKDSANDREIKAAARIAQASGFISEIGFDGEVAQGGANLSGGQKQRLAIARAIVRRPEIYIFDDSFSALDYKTDASLRAALKTELADATVIIVAQRISTVIDADRILVLDGGCIVGEGTHEELLHSCEVYREIVESQTGGGRGAAV